MKVKVQKSVEQKAVFYSHLACDTQSEADHPQPDTLEGCKVLNLLKVSRKNKVVRNLLRAKGKKLHRASFLKKKPITHTHIHVRLVPCRLFIEKGTISDLEVWKFRGKVKGLVDGCIPGENAKAKSTALDNFCGGYL